MAEIDEIMADYLLKGAKMLAKTCPACHAPLFEYKGVQFCVVCAESARDTAEPGSEIPADPVMARSMPADPPANDHAPSPGNTGLPEQHKRSSDAHSPEDSISEAMVLLCRRIAAEPDPARCLLYMQAVREGALSIATLVDTDWDHHPKDR